MVLVLQARVFSSKRVDLLLELEEHVARQPELEEEPANSNTAGERFEEEYVRCLTCFSAW